MDKSFIKELFIIMLLLVVVIFTLAILFYDSLNVDVEKIEAVDDISSQNIDKMMEEVKVEKNTDSNSTEKYTRRVTKEEIDEYFKENSYDTGKKNPFAETSDTKIKNAEIDSKNSTTANTTIQNATTANSTTTNTVTNTTKQDTTGRFFENKTSK